jgi:hypothetical protein
VMEYAEGKSLGQLLREQGRQPPTRAADFCYQAALGLHHAHSKGLVHRDVKPSNLLLTRDHCVKLLDLGLARFLQDHVGDATLTIAGSGMGTPDYMAPEQFHDARHADARSDIYSLGCTLYHLIAGCVPFPGTSMSEKFKCHTEQQPQALESFCPDVPAGLVLIVRRMMAKRPEDRFASAHQVGEAVAPFVAGSSALLPAIQATASWSGSRLDISVLPQGLLGAAPEQRRAAWYRRPAAWAWCSTACLLLLLSVPLARRIWPPAAPNEPDRNSTAAAGSDTPQNPSVPAAGGPRLQRVTVASKPGIQADCLTIRDALKRVLPGGRIEVLDDSEYAEALVLEDAENLRGITLETRSGATLVQSETMPQGVIIQNVADVTLRGFRFRAASAPQGSALLYIRGNTPGIVLEDLAFESTGIVRGITIEAKYAANPVRPLIIRRCTFKVGYDAIAVGGSGPMSGSMLIQENRILRAMRGIVTFGDVPNLCVVGNIVSNCEQVGLQLSDPEVDSRNILLANNVVRNCFHSFRIWDDPPFVVPPEGSIEVTNNVFVDALQGDVLYVFGGDSIAIGEVDKFHRIVRFHHNGRDGRGDLVSQCVPRTETDLAVSTGDFRSLDQASGDFLRPRRDSSLVAGGAGTLDTSLPAYVGARAPDGPPEWDWLATWKARQAKDTASE